MSGEDEPRVYEIRIQGCASIEEALALQEPIARVLCPDESHPGPCEVPWAFSLGDESAEDETTVLVVGIHTSGAKALEVVDQVRAIVGDARPVALSVGDSERFAGLVEQSRIESGSHGF